MTEGWESEQDVVRGLARVLFFGYDIALRHRPCHQGWRVSARPLTWMIDRY